MDEKKINEFSLTPDPFDESCQDAPFDMEVVSDENKKISANHLALMAASKYFSNFFKQYPFFNGIEVPVEDIAHEVLVKLIDLYHKGEVYVRNDMKQPLLAAIRKMNAIEPDADLRQAINEALKGPPMGCKDGSSDDEELYEDFPQVGLDLHVNNGAMLYWNCNGPRCTAECVTKLINGKVKIFKRNLMHSRECEEESARKHEPEVSNDDDDDDDDESKDLLWYCCFPGCKATIQIKWIDGILMWKQPTTHQRALKGVENDSDSMSDDESNSDGPTSDDESNSDGSNSKNDPAEKEEGDGLQALLNEWANFEA